MFLTVILGKITQHDLPGQGRTFRRKATDFWKIWPTFIPDGQVYDVIHVDGIYLRRVAVVLIAYADRYVVGWHVARKEDSRAYRDLLDKIPPPVVVVCDGGAGFEKARKECWPTTRVQRCVFHVFSQIKRYTTTRSLTSAGRELYRLGIDLTHVTTVDQRDAWMQEFFSWCSRHEYFLAEKTINDYGHIVDKHMRLVKAHHMVARLVKSGRLLTFLNPFLYEDHDQIGAIPATNNLIEGGFNTQLRALLRTHRGMSINR